jgi:formylmethanofuran dehydrogenase subunit E
MRTLEEDLRAAQEFHGHLCHGMVMGVRMARYACRDLGIDDPRQYRDLIVYVEMDRCASDAVSVVTGVTLGRRRLKWVDYGKLAATFVDLGTGRAVRLAPKADVPHAGRDDDPATFWSGWTDEQLFSCTPVSMEVPPQDRPGRPIRTVECAECGEQVQDGREIECDGRLLCRGCAGGAYYSPI